MNLSFVRHGRTKSNQMSRKGVFGNDDALNATGRSQIERAASILNEFTKPEIVVSSPYKRTRESAEILAEIFKITVEIDDRIQETDVGDWKGQVIEDVIGDWLKLTPEQVPSFRPPNGETWHEIGQRVAASVEEWADSGYESVLFVTHREPLRCGIGTLLETDPSSWPDSHFDNGSVSLLEASGSDFQAVFLNLT